MPADDNATVYQGACCGTNSQSPPSSCYGRTNDNKRRKGTKKSDLCEAALSYSVGSLLVQYCICGQRDYNKQIKGEINFEVADSFAHHSGSGRACSTQYEGQGQKPAPNFVQTIA